ncbi:MAG: GH92 family glycosyl hydrolase [Sporolactobacillus sp.]
MPNHFYKRTISCLLCLLLIFLLVPKSGPAIIQARTPSPSFSTSFEKGELLPNWEDRAEQNQNGRLMASGITTLVNKKTRHAMKTRVSAGPATVYTSSRSFGWTGKRVLYYSGKITGGKKSYATNRLFRVHIPVQKNTQLSYYIAPLLTNQNSYKDTAAYASIDLAFSDGTFLHQLKTAEDQDGFRMTPSSQGHSGTLLVNQWNHKSVNLGRVAAGKTITRILVAYQAPTASGSFRGAIDDLSIQPAKELNKQSPVDQVNILRGTNSNKKFSRGSTVPAVGVPNGFSYWSPATNSSSARHFYPYQENNDPENLPTIQSFSLSHSANVQDGDRQSFQVMPSDFSGTPSANRINRGLTFNRTNEIAHPDLYQVTFNNGIRVQMTALSHTAMLRFTFKGNTGNLIFDNIDKNGSLRLSSDRKSLYGYSDVLNSKTGDKNRLYLYGRVDQPVRANGSLYGQGRDQVTGYYKFNTSIHKTVTLRMASSLISLTQARKNLNLELGSKVSFNRARSEAAKDWNKRLNRVTVKGATASQRTTLYSSLYRLYLSPNNTSENTGTARKPVNRYADLNASAVRSNRPGMTGSLIRRGNNYTIGNFAYTAQTVWPAYALLEPALTGRIVNSYLHAMQQDDALISESDQAYADQAFSDVRQKNVPGISSKLLYQTLLKDASVNRIATSGNPKRNTNQKPFVSEFAPEGEKSLTGLLALCQRDYALGSLAASLASARSTSSSYADDSSYYLHHAQDYMNLFASSFNLNQEKLPGNMVQPKSLTRLIGAANPQSSPEIWRQAFNVPQDGQGLANIFGGQQQLAERLDQWMRTKPSSVQIKSSPSAKEAAAGKLGSFNLSNPVAPAQPYMYLFAGEPWKTQSVMRDLVNHFYTGSDSGQGYLGSDTDSMLSAFYLFAAAGFYPLQKGSSDYVLAAPYFKQMTIHLQNDRALNINAPEVSNKNRYVQSVTYNGQNYTRTVLPQRLLRQGGTLDFAMGAKPSKWGTGSNDLPDSLTPVSTNGSSFYPQTLTDLLTTDKANLSLKGLVQANNFQKQPTDITQAAGSEQPSIQAVFKKKAPVIRMYTLTSAEGNNLSDPKSWILYGSMNGKEWHPIDRRRHQSFAWRSMTRSFLIENPQPFRYYRLSITTRSGKYPLAIDNFQLLGYSGIRDGFNQVERNLIHQFEKNNLSESQTASLSSVINKAESAYRANNIASSIDYLQTYVQLVQSFAFEVSTPEAVRNRLSADGHALIDLLTE